MKQQELLNTIHGQQMEINRLNEQLNSGSPINFQEKYKKALREISGIINANRQLKEELLKLKNARNTEIESYVQIQKEEFNKAYQNILNEKQDLSTTKENLQLENEKLKYSLAALEETVARIKGEKMALAQAKEASDKAQKLMFSPEKSPDSGSFERVKTETKQQISIYKEKEAELRRTLENYEEHHATLNRVNRRLQENVNSLETKLFTVENQWKNRLNEKDIELREIKSIVREEYQDQISSLKKEIHQLRTYNNQLSLKLQSSQSFQIKGTDNQGEQQLIQTLKELKVQMEPMSIQIAELQEKNEYQREQSLRQKTNLQMKTSELEANIERMKENQKLLEKKLVRSNERIRELEEAERNISKLEEENRILGGQVIVLQSKEIALRNRGGDDLEERVMEFQSRVEMLLNDKETIANAKNVSIHQMIALKTYIMELDTKLKQLVSENEYSTKKYKSYKEKCQQFVKDLKHQESTVNSMKGKIQGYDKLVIKLQGELQRAITINDNEVKAMNIKISENSNTSIEIYKKRYESLLQKLSLQEKYSQQELETVKLHYETKIVELNLKLEELSSIRETISLYKSKNEELVLKLSEKENELLDTRMTKYPQEPVMTQQSPNINLLATKQMVTKLNESLAGKESQIFNLQNKLKTIEAEWKKKYVTLQNESSLSLSHNEKIIDEKNNQIENIEKENSELRTKALELENKIYMITTQQQQKANNHKKAQEVESKLMKTETEVKDLENKYETEQSRTGKLNKINEDLMKTIKQLEIQLAKTRQENARLENEIRIELESKNVEIQKLKMKVEDLESSVEMSATANQGMVIDTFKVNKMKVELEILQNDYKALEEDKNKYKTKLAQTETDLSLSRSRLEEIELLLQKTRDSLQATTNQTLIEHQTQSQKLQQKNTNLNQKVKQLSVQLNEQKTFIEGLKQENTNEKKKLLYELENKQQQYSKVYRECNKLKYQLANRNQWENNIKYQTQQKNSRYVGEIGRLKEQIMRLEDKYAFEQKEYIKYRQEFSMKVNELTDNISDRDDRIIQINTELNFLKTKQPELEDLLDSKEKYIAELNNQLIQIKDREMELENILSKITSQLNYYRSQDQQMQLTLNDQRNYSSKLGNDIAELRNRQNQLESLVHQKQSALSKFTSELQYLRSEKQHMEQVLATKQSYITRLANDLSSQKNIQLQMEEEFSAMDNQFNKQSSELNYYKGHINELEIELENKNRDLSKMKNDINLLEDKFHEMKNELYQKDIVYGKINGEIKYKNDYIVELEQDINSKANRIAELQNEVSKYRNQQYEFDAGTIEKQSLISRLNYENSSLKTRNEDLENDLHQRESQWIALNREVTVIKSNFENFEEELQSKDHTIQRYKQDMRIQVVKIEEMNNEVFEKNTQINRLNQEIFRVRMEANEKSTEEIYRLESQLYQTKNAISKIQGELDHKTEQSLMLQQELTSTRQQIKSYRYSDQQYEQLQQHFYKLQRANMDLKNASSEQQLEISQLESKIEFMTKMENDKKKQNQEERRYLESQLEQAIQRERELKITCSQLSELASYTREMDELKMGIQLYQEQIDRLNRIVEELQEEVSSLKLKLTTMTNQQDRLQENLTVMVMTFAEVEALRERIKLKQTQINDVRRSLVQLAANSSEEITSIKGMKLGENTEVIKSHIPIQMQQATQSMEHIEEVKGNQQFHRDTTIPYEGEARQENSQFPQSSEILQQVDESFNELQREYERREIEVLGGNTFSSKESEMIVKVQEGVRQEHHEGSKEKVYYSQGDLPKSTTQVVVQQAPQKIIQHRPVPQQQFHQTGPQPHQVIIQNPPMQQVQVIQGQQHVHTGQHIQQGPQHVQQGQPVQHIAAMPGAYRAQPSPQQSIQRVNITSSSPNSSFVSSQNYSNVRPQPPHQVRTNHSL